jgi:hypothetical protein
MKTRTRRASGASNKMRRSRRERDYIPVVAFFRLINRRMENLDGKQTAYLKEA